MTAAYVALLVSVVLAKFAFTFVNTKWSALAAVFALFGGTYLWFLHHDLRDEKSDQSGDDVA